MKEIQKKYKPDKQKQNEELMKFYRENKINPAASCLPMLAQFPVFIALYYTLRHFSHEPPTQHPGALVPPLHPVDRGPHAWRWGGFVLLVVYVASQMASGLFMAPTARRRSASSSCSCRSSSCSSSRTFRPASSSTG